MMRFVLVLMMLALAAPASAIDFTPTGSVLTATYREPTTNTDGSALNDLKETQIFFRVCPVSGACAAVFTAGTATPATTAAGGGTVNAQQTVPIAPGQENNVEVYAVARDTSGNVSPESPHVTKRVDRLSPAAPQ